MTSKHTPGPWHVNAIKNGKIVGDASAAEYDKMMINGTNAGVATVFRRRDASLIAAAPDMLAVLLEIIEHDRDDWDARLDTIHRAIAKATGAA